jgi:hypothetical protein
MHFLMLTLAPLLNKHKGNDKEYKNIINYNITVLYLQKNFKGNTVVPVSILPISASQVARITDMSHRRLAPVHF